MDYKYKNAILGASCALVYQIKQGQISQRRAGGYYNEDAKIWSDFDRVIKCITIGIAPNDDEIHLYVVDGLAHLRQSMRVDYDDWFECFPWLETCKVGVVK